MTEILIAVLFAALAISFYAVWKSAWRSASPSATLNVPPVRRKMPKPDPGLRRIATNMQDTIFNGDGPSAYREIYRPTTIPKEKA